MGKSFFIILSGFWMGISHAQLIGTTSQPLTSQQRLGLEAGGYLNRGAGTSALVRYLRSIDEDSALELGMGGATGSHGARAFGMLRTQLLSEDVDLPAIYLRGGIESYRDNEGVGRNSLGAGPLVTKGFMAGTQEVYAFVHPVARMGIRSDTDEFVWVTETSLGLNTRVPGVEQDWVASVEMNFGLQNSANAFTVGAATDF